MCSIGMSNLHHYYTQKKFFFQILKVTAHKFPNYKSSADAINVRKKISLPPKCKYLDIEIIVHSYGFQEGQNCTRK